jgi:hypothetical protein
MHSDFIVNADDTVSFSMIMAYNDEAMETMAETFGTTADELMAESLDADDLQSSLGASSDEVKVEDYAEDGYTGWVMTSLESQPLADLSGSASTGQSIAIERVGDEYILTGELDLSDEGAELDTSDPMFAGFMDSFDVEFSFTFPGPVTSSNGKISGNTVTFSPTFGELTEMNAVASASGAAPVAPKDEDKDQPSESAEPSATASDKPGSATDEDKDKNSDDGFPLWVILVAGGALLVVVAIVVVLVVRARKKKSSASVPPAGYGSPQPGASQWPSQPMPNPGQPPTQQWPTQPPGQWPAQPGPGGQPTPQWPAQPAPGPDQQPTQQWPTQPPGQWPAQPGPNQPTQQWPPQPPTSN